MTIRLRPSYSASHALIIGIDNYAHASPLDHAKDDARAVQQALCAHFAFPESNVTLLLDAQATRDRILRMYLSFASQEHDPDERLLFFFAGHGHTVPSRRGEVGYLVPHDGNPDDISSLLRWDDLTRNADLIPAKHLLFIMDACYGGLAITRALRPGSMRFLQDMLLRYSRQVITAGKADELVADLGGPLPAHSIFTGHLLEGLAGKAAVTQGIITANGLMAYVYAHVGHDQYSQQTPHFGYLEGDGDFIFAAPALEEEEPQDAEKGSDYLVSVPALPSGEDEQMELSVSDRAKDLLSDPRHRIRLHDLVTHTCRNALAVTGDDHFPLGAAWSPDEFAKRLSDYENSLSELMQVQALLAFWAAQDHGDIVVLPLRKFAARIEPASGLNTWLGLRWYPSLLLLYAAGMAAVAADNYGNLTRLLRAPNPGRIARDIQLSIALATFSESANAHDGFKSLPGHEKYYVPRSEYLLKLFQPMLDDLLFLGSDYEAVFDRFEILLALEYASQSAKLGHGYWGPIGRFGWKHHSGGASPLTQLIGEASREGKSWPPLDAGMFDGSTEAFNDTSRAFLDQVNRARFW